MSNAMHLIIDVFRYLEGKQDLKHLMAKARSLGPELVLLPREHLATQLYDELESLSSEYSVGSLTEEEFRALLRQTLAELRLTPILYADAQYVTRLSEVILNNATDLYETNGASNLSLEFERALMPKHAQIPTLSNIVGARERRVVNVALPRVLSTSSSSEAEDRDPQAALSEI